MTLSGHYRTLIFQAFQDKMKRKRNIFKVPFLDILLRIRGKIMPVKKNTEFWDIDDMIDYALKIYPISDAIKKDKYELRPYKEVVNKKIQRELKERRIATIQIDGSKDKYQLSSDFAKFFIEDCMYDYFMNDKKATEEKRLKRTEAVRDKILKDAETKSLENDRQLDFDKGVAHIANILNDESENNPLYDTDGNLKATLDNATWTKAKFHTLTNGERVKKESFGYHLPALTVDKMNEEIVNETIDRMMLRTLFDMFFDFDEKSFRHDLYERAAHIKEIDRDGITPEDGFSELTRKLENPLGIYVTPKKSK